MYVSLAMFLGWIIAVNATWFLILHDYRFLQNTLFYIFNAVVYIFVLGVALRDFDRLCSVLRWSCIVALALEVFYLELLYPGMERRATGSFNNPNQLGYWVILVFSCLGVVRRREPLGFIDLFGLALGCYAVALSLSRAATIAAGILVLAIVVSRGVRRVPGVLIAAVLIVGLMIEIMSGGMVERIMKSEVITALHQRISGIAEVHQDDDMERRGYGRLIDSAHYLAFGAGEGAYERLSNERYNKEFHSTLGNILMSYGVVGLAFFGLMLYVVFERSSWPNWAYLLAIMVYGITHMGLRDLLFWVLLALVFAQGRLAEQETTDPAGSRLPYPSEPGIAVVSRDAAVRR